MNEFLGCILGAVGVLIVLLSGGCTLTAIFGGMHDPIFVLISVLFLLLGGFLLNAARALFKDAKRKSPDPPSPNGGGGPETGI